MGVDLKNRPTGAYSLTVELVSAPGRRAASAVGKKREASLSLVFCFWGRRPGGRRHYALLASGGVCLASVAGGRPGARTRKACWERARLAAAEPGPKRTVNRSKGFCVDFCNGVRRRRVPLALDDRELERARRRGLGGSFGTRDRSLPKSVTLYKNETEILRVSRTKRANLDAAVGRWSPNDGRRVAFSHVRGVRGAVGRGRGRGQVAAANAGGSVVRFALCCAGRQAGARERRAL